MVSAVSRAEGRSSRPPSCGPAFWGGQPLPSLPSPHQGHIPTSHTMLTSEDSQFSS